MQPVGVFNVLKELGPAVSICWSVQAPSDQQTLAEIGHNAA